MSCALHLFDAQWCILGNFFGYSFPVHLFYFVFVVFWASLVAQMVKNQPAVQETWVQSLDWKDPLEKEMRTHSQCYCLENSMGREHPGMPQSLVSQRVGHD